VLHASRWASTLTIPSENQTQPSTPSVAQTPRAGAPSPSAATIFPTLSWERWALCSASPKDRLPPYRRTLKTPFKLWRSSRPYTAPASKPVNLSHSIADLQAPSLEALL
jgi:hypothetical protein